MAAGNWGQAADEAKAIIAEHPTSAKAWAYLGWAFEKLGQHSESVEPLRKAIILEPHFWQASYQLAQILDRMGRYPEALQHAREALRDKPGCDQIEGLIRGLERQVPEEITDAWQLSVKPMFHTVRMGIDDDPAPDVEHDSEQRSHVTKLSPNPDLAV